MSLDLLLGSWQLTMNHSQVAEPVLGSQRFERVLEGAFLSLDWRYERPDFPDAIALLDEHRFHYFDVRGVIRVFDFRIDEEGWEMVRLAPEFSQRSRGRFLSNDAIEVNGDRSSDDGVTWQHDFVMHLVRMQGS